MKKVAVIGMGIDRGTLTLEALDAINNAEVLSGAPRMLEMVEDLYRTDRDAAKRVYPHYLSKDITAMIETEYADSFAVLVSGDVGFYSAASGLAEVLTAYELRFIPGISTVSAFFARLKLPWQDAAFVSAHGRETNLVDCVRRNRLTFCLTGNNVSGIGTDLAQAGLGNVQTYAGENLGMAQEHVYKTSVEDLTHYQAPSLTVLLFQNEEFDDRMPFGLPDDSFTRLAGIPMTKSEIRAITLSKLNLRPTDICWDIGAGTGSVTVEMALNAYKGRVYAVERREDAIPLIQQNCTSFHLGNVTAVCGEAPAALDAFPAPDAVFIGGSGGEIDGIISIVLMKNPMARIVVTAVTLETVPAAMAALAKAGLEPEIVQINAARSKKAGGVHLIEAQNPVTIISAGGRP